MKYETESTINTSKDIHMTTPNTKNKPKPKLATIMTMFDETVALMGQRNNTAISVGEEAQNWFSLVQAFRAKVEDDQGILNKHEMAGRSILYSQLADAYKIGLELVNDKYLAALSSLLHRHSIAGAKNAIDVVRNNRIDREWNAKNPDAIQREMKEEVSPWVQVVKLLYGKWIDTTKMTDAEKQQYAKDIGVKGGLNQFAIVKKPPHVEKSVYQEWSPNRSAEKYAVVFRYMQDQGIKPENAAHYIDAFNVKPYGTKLGGIERAGRAAANAGKAPKPESQVVIDKRNAYVARAEARKNHNVFAVEKPNTWPSKVRYAKAVVKIEGDELVIVGFTEMDEKAYTNHAVAIGKPLLDKENEQAAERAEQVKEATNSRELHLIHGPLAKKLAELKADGADGAAISEKLLAMLEAEEKKLLGTKALGGFADMEPVNGR